ncbi:MAG: aminotransferase [Clostridiales bacterium]|nr:aminotransferase [Clostridiales bacterium]
MDKIQSAERMDLIHSDIRGKLYHEALKLEQQGEKILRLNTGNPAAFGFGMPESVREALLAGMDRAVAYCDSRGMKDAREAICGYETGKGIRDITPDDVFICNGVSEAAQMLCLTMLDPGDEVLMPCPCYSLWSNGARLAGAVPVLYTCDEQQDWYPDEKDIEQKITPRTRALLIINPNNPTGAVYDKEALLRLLDIARRHHLIIISDEIYDRLVLDDIPHYSCAALAPDLPVITCNGLSKSHIICGFRCGWCVLSGKDDILSDIRDAMERLSSMRLCGNTLTQLVIPAALKDEASTKAMLVPGGRLWEQRRAVMEVISRTEGITAVENRAAFYLFPKLDIKSFGIEDDHAFGLGLLREKHILIVPGTGFGYPQQDHFRIVMLPEPDQLRTAMEDIGDYLNTLRERNMK